MTSEYMLDYAIAAPDGTRRYHGVSQLGMVLEGYNHTNFPFAAAGTAMSYRRYAAFPESLGPSPALDPSGLNAGRWPVWAVQGNQPDIVIPLCATPTTSTITLNAPNSLAGFVYLGVRIGMVLKTGTNVPGGVTVTGVTNATVTVTPATLTVNAAFNTTQTFMTAGANNVIPTPDFFRETAQIPVGIIDSTISTLAHLGVAIEDIPPGRIGRIGGIGTMCTTWCIPTIASNTVGSYVIATGSAGRVTGSASTDLAPGSQLGIILAPAGTDRAGTVSVVDFQTGFADQVGILVVPG